MKNALLFFTVTRKIFTGAWLAFSLICLNLLTLPAAGQNNAAAYTWTTFAGSPPDRSSDGVGNNARFDAPWGVAMDNAGNLYVADMSNHTIRQISPAGVVTTLAGLAGIFGTNDGTGSAARFDSPEYLAVDSATNIYVIDGPYYTNLNSTIRKMTPVGTNWVVSTIAGPAGNGIAVDSTGNLYETVNTIILKLTPAGTNWVVSTIAGLAGVAGATDGTNSAALFGLPSGIAVDSGGNLYVADTYTNTIRKLTPAGTNWVVSTIAGLAGVAGTTDGTNNAARFTHPTGIAVDGASNVYVVDTSSSTIRKLTPVGTNWVVRTIAGATIHGSADGVGTNAQFYFPQGLAVDSAGNAYVADTDNDTIRKITSAGVVRTLAGLAGDPWLAYADGVGSAARFGLPAGVAVDSAGNVYVADTYNSAIRQISPAGEVFTMAGLAGNVGTNDGPGSNARFFNPEGLAVDSAGNVYVADTYNSAIREVTPAGVVTTPSYDFSGLLSWPVGVAVDSATNIYVADADFNTIQKIRPAGNNYWVFIPFAGNAGYYGTNDGFRAGALFNEPEGVAVDSAGNVYVADSGNSTIRKITPPGWVSTIAGSPGRAGSADGTNSVARFGLSAPIDSGMAVGVAVDSAGNLYVADSGNYTIRKITPSVSAGQTNWVVSTIGGQAGYFGSTDGVGSAALFGLPSGIAVDNLGNVYVADTGNNTIRKGVFTAYGAANPIAYSPPAMNSSLTLILLPPEANGQWRFPWELGWHNSGDTVSNLVAGNYPVEFSTVPGWLAIPPSLTVAVPSNSIVAITNQYYATLSTVDTNSGGTLTVTLGPNPPSGAGWGFLGNSPPWYPSGYSTNLAAGTYLIDFATVSGRVTPPNLSVQVQAGLTTSLDENYLLAQSAPGGVLLPTPVPSANISDLTDYPFGFNGQLETDVGYGSGVAVQANVVLTAAHLVFNDQALSYVSQAYWYFQEEAGVFQPEPLAARGWYVLSDYAAQRTNDLEVYAPDTSTPQSRNLDVAALYFLSPVAGGGYGGYLPSDESPNPWLTSTALKMLVGYPVDGSQFDNSSIITNGVMYQIGPQPYPLTLATDPVADQQVYTATWFLGYPGDSGGPVDVQFNGYYYPAGVYLGTLYSGTTPYASAVRAIDSDVVKLITNAATLGDTGTNNSGGGVITIIPNQAISTNNPGFLQFQLAPPAAVAAGAGWKLSGDTAYSTATNYTRVVTTTNTIVVQFMPIAGWNLPTNQTVTVLPYPPITAPTAFYTVTNPVLVAGKGVGLGITGTTGTVYQLQRRTNLNSGSWLPVSTNAILTNGFNLLLPNPNTNGNAFFYRAVWLGY
jgi:sugar lactone lactonase YvrE